MSKDSVTSSRKKRRKETKPRDRDASRARMFEAAKIRFSQNTYEGVGVRDIAADAGVDPSLVIRAFGSKEALFREIASQAFGTDEFLEDGVDQLPSRAADLLMSDINDRAWRSGYDPLRLLLASIGSPVAGPILAEYLDRNFVAPLRATIGGGEAAERGSLIAAWIVGFALMRIAASIRPDSELRRDKLHRLFIESVRHSIAGS
jgi:AcrR family transcriptional regulator